MDLKRLLESSNNVIKNYDPALKDLRLEEAEERIDGTYDVVVSYLKEDINKPIISAFLALNANTPSYERVYKRLTFTKDFDLKKLSIYKN